MGEQMRLATLRTEEGTSAARLEGDRFDLLRCSDVGALLAAGMSPADLEPIGSVPVAGASLAPVIPQPGKIICLGLNYKAHVLESGRDLPAYPTMFAKFSEALIGPPMMCSFLGQRSPNRSTGKPNSSWSSAGPFVTQPPPKRWRRSLATQ